MMTEPFSPTLTARLPCEDRRTEVADLADIGTRLPERSIGAVRKTLIAALAAFVVVGAAGAVAVAQSPSAGAEITAKISPSKVGTKKKPKPTKITLEVKNSDSSQTAKELKIYTPKQITVNGKGLKYCKQSKLESNLDPAACPDAVDKGCC